MSNELYRDFIDRKADSIINSLGGTITPAPANAELYRDFLDRKFDDVINAISGFNPVKSYTYTGTGTSVNHRIDIPNDCKMIIAIEGATTTTFGRLVGNLPIRKTGHIESSVNIITINSPTIFGPPWHIDFFDGYMQTSSSSNSMYNLNTLDVEYTVYYI